MKIIEKLSDMIEEEINDAHKYARCYQSYRESDSELAKTFSLLSQAELTHVEMLHSQVVRLISDYRKANGEPPEKMKYIYDYLHQRHIEKVNEVKFILEH